MSQPIYIETKFLSPAKPVVLDAQANDVIMWLKDKMAGTVESRGGDDHFFLIGALNAAKGVNLTLDGGVGQDTVTLETVTGCTICKNTDGTVTIRNANQSVITLKGMERVEYSTGNSYAFEDLGTLPVGRTINLKDFIDARHQTRVAMK